jgi:hypothetical protein
LRFAYSQTTLAAWIPNEEGKDLPQPLPIKTKSEIQKVKLYQMEGSPPCCAIRAFLTMADVAYETVEVDFVSKSELSFSKYKKVPILTVNGYQINDSAIMIKTLSPICYGRSLSEVEQTQIDETTTKTMLAFEIAMFKSDQNIQKYLAKFVKDEGCMSWILKVSPHRSCSRPLCCSCTHPLSPHLREHVKSRALIHAPRPPQRRACRA